MFRHQAPPKLKDPGALIISRVIKNITIECALLDLGVCVNILSGFLYDIFGIEDLKSTTSIVQLPNMSTKIPRRILEDVFVKVEDFYFPVNFLILDMKGTDVGHQTPIILGRPFLAIANASIDCRTGEMDVSFGNKRL
jgi:hypothetical protein